jgi:hypothetical protein
MKKVFFLLITLAAGIWADSEVSIQRADSKINAGFRERVYIDGKNVLTLGNGQSGTVRVADGNHVIYAELSTLKTPQLNFSSGSGALRFTITPYSLTNFVVEQTGNGVSQGASQAAANAASAAARTLAAPGTVEGSLEAAADKLMEKIPPRARVAIVYVTAEDPDVAEFIAGELEFFLVENDRVVIDRSQLDRIRREQELQMSGEIDDDQAVNIGKIAGASVIITGAVTGRGDLRRLRLRALDTQSAQVLSAASEKY